MPTAPRSFRPAGHTAAIKAQQRDYDNTPERREALAFRNSAAWKRIRAYILARDPVCRECERQGRVTPSNQVDHIIPRRERPDLALDADNLQGLCRACHTRKTSGGR